MESGVPFSASCPLSWRTGKAAGLDQQDHPGLGKYDARLPGLPSEHDSEWAEGGHQTEEKIKRLKRNRGKNASINPARKTSRLGRRHNPGVARSGGGEPLRLVPPLFAVFGRRSPKSFPRSSPKPTWGFWLSVRHRCYRHSFDAGAYGSPSFLRT